MLLYGLLCYRSCLNVDYDCSIVIPEKKQYAYIKGYDIGFHDTIDPLFGKVRMSDVDLYVNLTNTTIEEDCCCRFNDKFIRIPSIQEFGNRIFP